jgi:tRNA threonylcarbamoyladenosine biosynthesis protein TsaE
MEFYKEVTVKSLKELDIFAKNLAKCLKGDEVFLLIGNLSAGKTTFTKFLVSSLGIADESEINSPTFTVMNEYETEKGVVFHIDLYRVKNFDITDILGYGIIIIEWADEKEFENIDFPVIKLEFEIKDKEKRTIKIFLKNADYLKKCI